VNRSCKTSNKKMTSILTASPFLVIAFRFELASAGNGRIYAVSSCLANLERNSGVGIREAAKVGILGLDEL